MNAMRSHADIAIQPVAAASRLHQSRSRLRRSSIGRTAASQAECREFDSHRKVSDTGLTAGMETALARLVSPE